jgi:hypothetical protein
MPEDMLGTLQSIDPMLLAGVVRQDQLSTAFEITEWTVKRLSDKGMINPNGLFLFSGEGYDERGTRSWSVVLKYLKDPGEEQNAEDVHYWKRETLLIQTGLLASLPHSIARPRFYGTTEREGSVWVWMEHIVQSKPHWTIDQYVFAARQIGRFNAACLTLNPMPDYPWLCKGHLRKWLEHETRVNAFWESPFANQTFSHLRERWAKLWGERERFLNTLDRLPQVFSHFDLHRYNLMIRQQESNQEEVVALDWAICGYGALGGDAYALIIATTTLFEVEPAALPELEAAVFPAYLEGLQDAGWQGNPELARLGYTAWTALWQAAAAPVLVALWNSDSRHHHALQLAGRSPEAFAAGYVMIYEFALDRADEARQLMDRLGF